MAGFSSDRPNAPITGINVTPLVDITLVLLIIFMVTAKLVVSRSMPMDLPKAATGGTTQQVLAVGLQADGQLSVDGEGVGDDRTLVERARLAMAEHPNLRAVVQADGSAAHRRVIHVLDLLRQAGVVHVAFAVEQGPSVETEP
jgi:biopolymer transport protein ExbD